MITVPDLGDAEEEDILDELREQRGSDISYEGKTATLSIQIRLYCHSPRMNFQRRSALPGDRFAYDPTYPIRCAVLNARYMGT